MIRRPCSKVSNNKSFEEQQASSIEKWMHRTAELRSRPVLHPLVKDKDHYSKLVKQLLAKGSQENLKVTK